MRKINNLLLSTFGVRGVHGCTLGTSPHALHEYQPHGLGQKSTSHTSFAHHFCQMLLPSTGDWKCFWTSVSHSCNFSFFLVLQSSCKCLHNKTHKQTNKEQSQRSVSNKMCSSYFGILLSYQYSLMVHCMHHSWESKNNDQSSKQTFCYVPDIKAVVNLWLLLPRVFLHLDVSVCHKSFCLQTPFFKKCQSTFQTFQLHGIGILYLIALEDIVFAQNIP